VTTLLSLTASSSFKLLEWPTKNLRLDSRFSMIGAFWLPETPDTILKGTLVSDEREINFITAPEYERPISLAPACFDARYHDDSGASRVHRRRVVYTMPARRAARTR